MKTELTSLLMLVCEMERMETAALLKATAGWMKGLDIPPFRIGGSRTGAKEVPGREIRFAGEGCLIR